MKKLTHQLTHPLGKTIPHNSAGAPSPSGPSADAALKALKTTTKLARFGGQAATSDVGGPAFTRPI